MVHSGSCKASEEFHLDRSLVDLVNGVYGVLVTGVFVGRVHGVVVDAVFTIEAGTVIGIDGVVRGFALPGVTSSRRTRRRTRRTRRTR